MYSKVKFFFSIFSKKKFWTGIALILLLFIVIGSVGLFFEYIGAILMKVWWIKFLIGKLKITLIINAVLIMGTLLLLAEVRNIILDFFYFRKLNKKALVSRNEIAEVYLKLKRNKFFASKLISYLENNVQKVTGEFPSGFLRAGQSSSMTRLIQLEERWREAEEREVSFK